MRQSNRTLRLGAALAMALLVGHCGQAQTIVNPSGQRIVAVPATPVVEVRTLNAKQRELADETDRLLSMATRLKQQVDMTSKNILSIKVVRTAEDIEIYVHRLKNDAKK